MSFTLHRLKKRLSWFVGLTADWALFIGLVLVGGIGSSWYVVEAGSTLMTRQVGPWTVWTAAGRGDADPYTRAHFAREGSLPLNGDVAETFVAMTDSDGKGLHSSCTYTLEGRELATHWWSLGVFDTRGRLIANPAERYAFTSDTIAMAPDGTFKITLSRDAEAGNWLPIGGGGKLALVFTAIDLGVAAVETDAAVDAVLPKITRGKC